MKKTKEELKIGLLKLRAYPPLTKKEKQEVKDWDKHCKKIEMMMENEKVMRINELRIGNIVSHDDYTTEFFEVLSIESSEGTYIINTKGGKNGTWLNDIDLITKVPITSDFLYLMGFEYNQWTGYWDCEGVRFSLEHFDFYYTYTDDFHPDESSELLKVKYVHQLQNLYFDLMGVELIK